MSGYREKLSLHDPVYSLLGLQIVLMVIVLLTITDAVDRVRVIAANLDASHLGSVNACLATIF